MPKYSPEWKERLVRKYHESNAGIASLANKHMLSACILQPWYKRYQTHNVQAFEKKYSVYSAKLKLSALEPHRKGLPAKMKKIPKLSYKHLPPLAEQKLKKR